MKKGKYWVLVTRVEVNETGKAYEYGEEFPDLNDETRMEKLLKVGIIGTSKPQNIPQKSDSESPSAFEPSQPYEELEKDIVKGEK